MQTLDGAREWTESEMDLIYGSEPWPDAVQIHRPACNGGPCNQGRGACPTPDACRVPDKAVEPDFGPRWGFLAFLVSAVLVLSLAAYFVK